MEAQNEVSVALTSIGAFMLGHSFGGASDRKLHLWLLDLVSLIACPLRTSPKSGLWEGGGEQQDRPTGCVGKMRDARIARPLD